MWLSLTEGSLQMNLQGQLVHSIRLDPNGSQKWQHNGNPEFLT